MELSIDNSGNSACGGIFRDQEANILYCFDVPHGHSNSYLAEISGALRVIRRIG